MLRALFPVNVQTSQANFEIQYGYIQRPLHKNTSWEEAKWEVPGQRFMDLSELDYGVALLNDCKYGYGLFEGLLDLDLLRSPKYPDYFADRGAQEFTYALYPHAGHLTDSDVQQQAEALNAPLKVHPAGGLIKDVPGFIQLPDSSVRCQTIKAGEREACRIFRLYESLGRRRKIKIEFNHPVKKVMETDLMEKYGKPLPLKGRKLELAFKPFEIKSLKVISP